jgi:hypothetical protein
VTKVSVDARDELSALLIFSSLVASFTNEALSAPVSDSIAKIVAIPDASISFTSWAQRTESVEQ